MNKTFLWITSCYRCCP